MIRFKIPLLLLAIGCDATMYEGDVVLEALPESEDHLHVLFDLDKTYTLDFWYPESVSRLQPNEHFQVHVLAEEKYDVVKGLMAAGIMFRIMHRNLDKMIDVSHSSMGDTNGIFDRGELDNYNYFVYHKMDEIYSWANKMVDMPENKMSKKSIGTSWENRDLFVLVLDEPTGVENPPKIFLDCGVHAREWISHAFCQYFVDQLANPNSKFGFLREGIEWHIMPVVNPDGYIYSWESDRFWRKNRNPNQNQATQTAQKQSGARMRDCGVGKGVGVDLNRNYAARWELGDKMIGASKWCRDQNYQGSSAFSEPESQAHSNYVMAIQPKAYLTIHSYGQVVLFPYTWTRDAERPHNYNELITISTEISKRIGGNWRHGQGKDIFYPAAGGSDDWAHSIGVDLSFTFELRDKGNYGFMLPEFLIPAAVEEAARGISAIYDHLVPKSDGTTNTDAAPAIEKPQRKTKCTLNPEEAYIGDRVLDPDVTPTFQCTMKNGKCKTTCPPGTQPKLKKAACKKNGNTMIWKPDARRWHTADICAQGLSVAKHTNFVDYCKKYVNGVSDARMSSVEKNCSVVAGGKKIQCIFTCRGESAKTLIKMGKSGPSAGTKKFLVPVCNLIKNCF